MNDQLMIQNLEENLIIPSDEIAKVVTEISLAQSFLPSLKLMQNTSPEVGNETLCKPPAIAGEFFLTQKNKRLKTPIICVIAYRPHALLILGGKKVKESFNA